MLASAHVLLQPTTPCLSVSNMRAEVWGSMLSEGQSKSGRAPKGECRVKDRIIDPHCSVFGFWLIFLRGTVTRAVTKF